MDQHDINGADSELSKIDADSELTKSEVNIEHSETKQKSSHQ